MGNEAPSESASYAALDSKPLLPPLVDEIVAESRDYSVQDIFDMLSKKLGGYENRLSQLELAEEISRSFKSGKTGVFEAGTGVGKSFAAIIPALLSGKTVVVSTATIALQEQYINKDIPALQEILPFKFSAVLLKGRGNYLGMRRFHDHLLEQAVDPDFVDWVNTTETGDISELAFLPPGELWMEINSDSDDCLRNRCPNFNSCFYFDAKRRAEKADLIVVNHALLLADAASHGGILPPYQYLIVDEAHHLPDVATDAFSLSVSNRGIKRLLARAAKRVNAPAHLLGDIEIASGQFYFHLYNMTRVPRFRLHETVEGVQELIEALDKLRVWLENCDFSHILDVEMAREKAQLKAKSLITTISAYIKCLKLLEDPSQDYVTWVERTDRAEVKLEVVAAPLDASPYIADFVLNKPGLISSVWMSATLATAGDDPFKFFKDSIGADRYVVQKLVSSPFDFENQALLYLPRDLPEPNHPDFAMYSMNEIERLIELSEGRAFVLFTSRNALNFAYEELAPRLPYESRRQGEMPRPRLIEWFKSTPNAVLFGTASFWEGVSIDGSQLSCVIIDRIPFQVPDDPVYEARCQALEQDPDRSWFTDLALPYATMRLKQGVGRLIRTSRDRGIVAILDNRLTKKYYGRRILECLPPMKIIRCLPSAGSGAMQDFLDLGMDYRGN